MDDNSVEILRRLGQIIDKMAKDTLSVQEAADYLKTSVETVEYYAKRQKQITHANLGGILVFRKKDLDDFLEKKMKKGYVI